MGSADDTIFAWSGGGRRLAVCNLNWKETQELASRVLRSYRRGWLVRHALIGQLAQLANGPGSLMARTSIGHWVGFVRPAGKLDAGWGQPLLVGCEVGVDLRQPCLCEGLDDARKYARQEASRQLPACDWRIYQLERGLSRAEYLWRFAIGNSGRSPARTELEAAVRAAIASDRARNHRTAA